MLLEIMEQDHEEVYPANLDTLRLVSNDFGVNLVMDYEGNEVILGTFEDSYEAAQEFVRLQTFTGEFFVVKGYSNGGFAEW